MSAWFKRFALHLAAAVGATGVFVAAAAVGASQNRQQVAVVSPPIPIVRTRTPAAERKPTVVVTPTATTTAVPTETPTTAPTPTSGGPANEPTTLPTSPPAKPAAQAKPQAPPPPQPTPTSPPQDEQQDVSPPADEPPQTQSNAQPKPQAKPAPAATPTPKPTAVAPERSLAGTIKAVQGDGLEVLGVGGREWHVTPAPGALIRLNGKTAKLENLQVGQSVVILGQAQSGPGARFLAHAITAKSK